MHEKLKSVLKTQPSLFAIAYLIKQHVTHLQNFEKYSEDRHILKQIQKRGFFIMPNFVDKKYCERCVTDVDNMMRTRREYVHKAADDRIFGSEYISENIMQFAKHEILKKLANEYNTIITEIGFTMSNVIEYSEYSNQLGSGGGWHRDSINRQFKAILYLNDVTEENGAYQIIEGSHKLGRILDDIKTGNLSFHNTRYDDSQIDRLIRKNPNRLKTLVGKAGTLILKDCSAIHRGSPLYVGKRYALTNYYFYASQINSRLTNHFAPLISVEKVLAKSR